MKLTLAQARRRQRTRIVVESLDLSLYIARAELADGTVALLVDGGGRALRTHNLLAMKTLLAGLAPTPLALRQESAYDEMCGQGGAPGRNALELPLDGAVQPPPRWLH